MNAKEKAICRFLLALYKDYYDRNAYNRTNYDEDLEYYQGYRNADDYPLYYNNVFNRILPTTHQLLARFMDQLYQAGNIISAKPRKKADLERAKKAEATLNFQMESLNDIDMQGGSYLTMMKWMFNNVNFGKGIVKAYWRKEERIGPRRMALHIPNFDRLGNFQGYDIADYVNQEMQTMYDGPYVEVIHNKLFIPHPQFKSIQQMPWCFLIYKKPIDYIKKMANKGVYLAKNLKELGWESDGQAGTYAKDSDEAFAKGLSIEGGLTKEELRDELRTPEVDILECYGKLIFDDAPYEVGSGVKIKGYEEEAIVHIGNYKTILSIQRNIYGMRPLFDMGCYMHPEMYWDIGIIRLCKGIQEQINTLGNLRTQNAMMHVNSMLRVDPEADIDPQALVWRPFGIVPAMKEEVEPLVIPDTQSQVFMEQENFYDKTIQDLTGMYSYNMGQTPQRQERVGVVYSIQSMGEARAKLMLMSMDYLGIRPLLKYMMVLNTFHLPSGFEYRITDKTGENFGQIFGDDIHPDFDFAARYTAMEPALGKQFRAQQLVQMAQLWAEHPWINQYQMCKTIMELLDIREADLLLKTQQQLQQEMQQQVQSQMISQMQAERAKGLGSAAGKLLVSAQDFQEERALNEQEFRHNMALESIKQEATNQKSD